MTLPPPHETALLLDLDGTLLDIAPTPDAVIVPLGLADSLARLRDQLDGALAIVTGRPVDQVDALLPGIPYAVAGEHGGAIRFAPGAPLIRTTLPEPPPTWPASAARIVERHPGALLELKQRGFVFHYRQAPHWGEPLREAATSLVAPVADRFQLMPALMAWEVRPRGADKGSAVQALAAVPPFNGRRPVFIGDDVTDEDGMAAARHLGGAGLRVPDRFGSAAGVRAWIAASATALATGQGWPTPQR